MCKVIIVVGKNEIDRSDDASQVKLLCFSVSVSSFTLLHTEIFRLCLIDIYVHRKIDW